MTDSKSTSSSTSTTEVLGRVEGVDEHGRPRVIRCFYPEDDYSQGHDTRKRKHLMVQCQAKDVAKVAKS